MKVLYSELKQFLPNLKASPKAVGEALTMSGLLMDALDEVTIGGKKDWLIGLEVRQNRPDCLGVLGIAREVAASFALPFNLPKYALGKSTRLPQVKVKAAGDVRRACVLQVDGLRNNVASPAWLAQTMELHGVNSVSLLVDISNYAMIMTGYPNHIFDAGKVVGGLVWERSTKAQTLTTLDGTTLELKKGKELVISDNLGPLVLASAVGGRRSAISERTVSVLGEVAVYDGAKMKSDARSLGVATEASARLEKDLSAEDAAWALSFLGQALVKYAGGVVSSAVFDYYPAVARKTPTKIVIDSELATRTGGVTVSLTETERLLKRLGFGTTRKGSGGLLVEVPAWRPDVTKPAEVAEEILRLFGFQNIRPTAPALRPVSEVTPKNVVLSRALEAGLSRAGFDEVLSLPLTTSEWNGKTALQELGEIRTQNAINEEVPVLRQSLAGGLLSQQHEYIRRGVTHVQLFEIGKVFGRQGRKIVELERCGLLVQSDTAQQAVARMYETVQVELRQLGAARVGFETLSRVPALANPHAAWNIVIGSKVVGWMYQVQPLELSGNRTVGGTVFAELDYEQILLSVASEHPRSAQELLTRLVVLDGNVETGDREELDSRVAKISRTIGRPQLWSLEVVDGFKLESGRTRYTLRVTYQNLTDSQAKALHGQAFETVGA
ncbi:MAG: hypothetical protein JNK33_01400 [Candidatus Doudnabacteria bacterium]|nr:hypothetical protein [Candidatus Doudnabacteria bacterium]